jgi:hypothetical protein
MKKVVFLLALGLTIGLGANAQDGVGGIKTNPWGWFAGQYQFGYEHFLGEHASVQLMPGGIYGEVSLTPNDTAATFASVRATRSGLIVIPEFRYYLGDEAPRGLYIAPFARYRNVTTRINNDQASSRIRTAIGGGFVLGYQYKLANGLMADLFMGPQFKSSTTSTTGSFDDYGFAIEDESDTGIRFGLNIGYAW